jgi:hypothetical protein
MIDKALMSLRPGAAWALNGNTLGGLIWRDTVQSRPTDAEIEAEVTRLQDEYARNEYQRLRATAYPSFADQFDLLYHGGYDAWKAAVDAVKTQYPKPGNSA